jgi:predicted Zn-dependent protease
MKNLAIYLLDIHITLFDDVLKDEPEKINIDTEDFLQKIGAGIFKKFEKFFENFKIFYIPPPMANEINSEDFYIDTIFPYRSGLAEEYIIRKLKEENVNDKYYRILGIYPGTIWFKTDIHDLVPYIKGTSESNIALISLQTFFKNDINKLLSDAINISCHELGHTFGLEHHEDCIMSQGDKKPFFCRECLRKIHKWNRSKNY